MAVQEETQVHWEEQSAAHLNGASKIIGSLVFQRVARIEGQVQGDIVATDRLEIGESAMVVARIQARSVVISGKVEGDINASEHIEIRPSATVTGNLVAPTLVIYEGAVLSMQNSTSPEEHKRGELPERKQTRSLSERQRVIFITGQQRLELLKRGYDEVCIDRLLSTGWQIGEGMSRK